MTRVIRLTVGALIVVATGCQNVKRACPTPPAADLYVSLRGNDAWSGTIATPNADGSDGPLASLDGARRAVRRKRLAAPDTPITVAVRGGAYRMDCPVVFTPEDSGSASAPVTFQAWPGETPVFSGGVPVTGWAKASRGLWSARVPGTASGAVPPVFRRLYVNDERRTLARTPNDGSYFRIAKQAAAYTEPATGEETDARKFGFTFKDGDLQTWPRLNEITAVVLRNWESAVLPIKEVQPERQQVVFTGPMKWELRKGLRYYVEGFREALDAPGEWWYDRRDGTLWYRPLRGENPNKLSIVAPRITQLIVMKGDASLGTFVEHLTFDGLVFAHTDYTVEPEGHSDWQAAVTIPAAIQADGTRNITFRRCEVRNIGQYGIWFHKGCCRNRVEHCELRDLGAGGVRIGEMGRRVGPEATSGNVVHNNFIHDGTNVFYGAIPVWIGQSSDNQVTHNEICDFNYTGISVGWCWSFAETSCHRNEIAWNHLHRLGRGVLYDMAAIYTLGVSTGTTIHHNLIHHIWGYVEGYGAGGIYPDQGSSGLLIENNLAYLTQNGGLTVHYGRENKVQNNIFALNQRSQIHLGRKDKESNQTLDNNIIYYSEGKLFVRMSELHADGNVYWHTDGPEAIEFPGGVDFAEWQKQGYDKNSVIADPMFVNPRKFDFRLKPDSPALKLGFKPFDLSTAGLVGEAAWRARPAAIKRRKMTSLPEREVAPTPPILEDFELAALGKAPPFGKVYGTTDKTGIVVSDEAAANSKRSLKFTDAAGLKNQWNPHLACKPSQSGRILHGSFDLLLKPGAVFTTEWRYGGSPFVSGPNVGAKAGGDLTFNGNRVTAAPVDTWIHVDLVCDLRKKDAKTCTAVVTVEGQQPVSAQTVIPPAFKGMENVVFVADGNETGEFFLDNVVLETRKK